MDSSSFAPLFAERTIRQVQRMFSTLELDQMQLFFLLCVIYKQAAINIQENEMLEVGPRLRYVLVILVSNLSQ